MHHCQHAIDVASRPKTEAKRMVSCGEEVRRVHVQAILARLLQIQLIFVVLRQQEARTRLKPVEAQRYQPVLGSELARAFEKAFRRPFKGLKGSPTSVLDRFWIQKCSNSQWLPRVRTSSGGPTRSVRGAAPSNHVLREGIRAAFGEERLAKPITMKFIEFMVELLQGHISICALHV